MTLQDLGFDSAEQIKLYCFIPNEPVQMWILKRSLTDEGAERYFGGYMKGDFTYGEHSHGKST